MSTTITSSSKAPSIDLISRTETNYSQYLAILIGQSFSIFGSQIVSFALIWYLVTLVSGSVSLYALIIMIMNIPPILIIPLAGVFADRWDRKKTIIVADLLITLTTLAMIAMFIIGPPPLWGIIVVSILRGIFQSFHSPAINAIVPAMVPSDKLPRVNGLKSFSTGVVQIIAPVIAAGLMVLFPIQAILWIDVITFLIALVPILLASIPSISRSDISKSSPSFIQELATGFSTLKSTSGLMLLAGWSACFNFLILPFGILLPIFINVIHAGSGSDYAVIAAIYSVGFLVGSLAGSVKKKWKHVSLWILISGFCVFMASTIVILAPHRAFQIMGVGQFLGGFFMAFAVILYSTALQRAVPLEFQGRIYSIDMFFSLLIAPITIYLGGPISETMGIVQFFLLYSILGMVMNILVYFLGLTKRSLGNAEDTENILLEDDSR
ncbi:MAG: MFS transporter [Promethearchaeota archaeon]